MAARQAATLRRAEAEISVRPINGFIGAEIDGVDLSRPLTADRFKIVHDTLIKYEVIVLRDAAGACAERKRGDRSSG